MKLERLKALAAGSAILLALTACEAGADARTGSEQQDVAQQDAPAAAEGATPALAMSFDELPEAERNARQALGEEIVRQTAPEDFLSAIEQNIVDGVKLSIPMNYQDLTEEEQAQIDALAPQVASQYGPDVLPRLGRVYASLFTVEEMEAIVGFLQSEAGQKYRALAVEANAGIGEVLQNVVGGVQNDVMREVRPEAFGLPAQDGEEPSEDGAADIDLTEESAGE